MEADLPPPPRGEDASVWPLTSDALLHNTDLHGGPSKWLAYAHPTRMILRRLRVPASDIEDLTMDALERLSAKAALYDPARGRFRSYYATLVRNVFIDYYNRLKKEWELREKLRHVADTMTLPATGTEAEGELRFGGADIEILIARGRELFEEFIAAQPPTLKARRNAETLHQWVVDGVSQKELAATLGKTERTVRNVVRRGVEAFADWARERFHPDDVALLAKTARVLDDRGDDDPSEEDLQQLFRYMSEEKRRVTLAVLGRLRTRD